MTEHQTPQQQLTILGRSSNNDELTAMSGNLILFLVEYDGHELLVADKSLKSVSRRYHMHEDITYVGRASKAYTTPMIIRSW